MFLVFSKELIILCLKQGDEIKYYDKEITVKKRKHENGEIEYWFDDNSKNDYCINIYNLKKNFGFIYEDNEHTRIHFIRKDGFKDVLGIILGEIKRDYKVKYDVEKLKRFIFDCMDAWKEMFDVKEKKEIEIIESHYPEPSPI